MIRQLGCLVILALVSAISVGAVESYSAATGFGVEPYAWQVGQQVALLKSEKASDRATALENLSTMRAYGQEQIVLPMLSDSDAAVRRESAMNLGWTGGAAALPVLLTALEDGDWTVRQAAAVSLGNLTALDLPFDALANAESRTEQLSSWQQAVQAFDPDQLVPTLRQYTKPSIDFFRAADIVRAIGLMRVRDADAALLPLFRPYATRTFDLKGSERSALQHRGEKLFVQAGIRALGLLGTAESKALLIELLEVPQWAVYAADALGDCGDETAAAALMSAYPSYSYFGKGNGMVQPGVKVPRSDYQTAVGYDRLHRIPNAILRSLTRIPFESEDNMKQLRSLAPLLLANLPLDFDATLMYNEEPFPMMVAYMLERAGLRRAATDAAWIGLGLQDKPDDDRIPADFLRLGRQFISRQIDSKFPPFAGTILVACERDPQRVPALLELLEHKNNWLRIHAAKTLLFMEADAAVPVLKKVLQNASDDASYGFDVRYAHFNTNNIENKNKNKNFGADYPERFRKFFYSERKLGADGYDEYNDPTPRFKEAFIMVLGAFKAKSADQLLIKYLNNDQNVVEVQLAAAKALYQLATPDALESLRKAEAAHPYASVQQVAREAVWLHNLKRAEAPSKPKTQMVRQQPVPEGLPKELVFIKGPFETGNHMQIPSDNTAYTTTDGGPTYRLGNNIFYLNTDDLEGSLRQLTFFEDGYVADLEVSYDGQRLLFARRGPPSDPWWHIYEMDAKGGEPRQITRGPYHDVQPNYMPDGRIVFSSTRLGMRDEYHGYLSTGLSTMNADGSDIQVIGFNLGRDAEPVIGDDGKILFTRLELIYSRMKTEWNLLSVFPDGTGPNTLYGPERRDVFRKLFKPVAAVNSRHRFLSFSQPQSWSGARFLINTFRGPALAGPGPLQEQFLRLDRAWAVTTPYPIDDQTLLVAAGERPWKPGDDGKKEELKMEVAVDHGLHYMDVDTGELTLIYDDPDCSDFEARPLQPRKVPALLPEAPFTRERSFSGTILCNSIYNSRHEHVRTHGKYVRVVEGIPPVARHQTHKNKGVSWRNHGGAVGRDLGTVPVAADGSFAIRVPSDRMFHLQVLDSDRYVIGNELIWQYVRPGENKSCVGCHEAAGTAPVPSHSFAKAHRQAPVDCLPNEHDFLSRAKMWFKGWAPDEREERMRSANAINLIGRP